MHILVITQYFWPENFRINDLVAELVERSHHVTVLTGIPNYPDGNVFEEFSSEQDRFFNYKGADIIRVPMVARGQGNFRLMLNYLSFAISASLVGAWRLRGRKFDIIFTFQGSPVTVGLPAVLMRSIKRAPSAIWVLDLWPESLEAVGAVRNRLLLKIVSKLVKFIYTRCDLILAQSKSFIPQIQKYVCTRVPVRYFPSWAELIFDVANAVPSKVVPFQVDRFNVMFAGNIGDAQDFPSILGAAELLKKFPHIRWLVVGDGRVASWVANEVKRRNLQESLLLLGRHPLEQMPSFFKHADVLLVSLKDHPIFSMTIPGKLQSYLAAGIPVVAMLNGEGSDVVKNSGCGLACAAGDEFGLADAVLRLSKMGVEERQALGRNGLSMSKREFNRQLLMNQLDGWLTELKLT